MKTRFSYRMAKRPNAEDKAWFTLFKDFLLDEHKHRTRATGERHALVAAYILPNANAYVFRLLEPAMPEAHMRVYERAGRKGSSRPIDRVLHEFGVDKRRIRVMWVGPESEYRAVEYALIALFKDRGLAPYNILPGTLKAPTERKPAPAPERKPAPEPHYTHFTDTFCQNAGLGLWTDPHLPALYIHVEPGRWGHLRKFKYRFQCPVSGTVHMGRLGFPEVCCKGQARVYPSKCQCLRLPAS